MFMILSDFEGTVFGFQHIILDLGDIYITLPELEKVQLFKN